MNWKKQYERWQKKQNLDKALKDDLLALADCETDLEDCFYKNLEFGTGGMRGEIGPGTNRMNIYTVRKGAQGLAQYIKEAGSEAAKKGVVIAYDNRRMSKEFALEAACTLGANGVKSYVFKALRPTPELSFAVRELDCHSGIMITASHNPPEYNGFKVYGEDGGQLVPEDADRLITMVNAVEDELEVVTAEATQLERDGLLEWILEELDDAYLKQMSKVVMDQALIDEMGNDITIVFTPLHGTAYFPMTEALKQAGFSNVHVVSEQAEPDTEFSTVRSPNPEERDAFELAMKLGKEKNADVLIATDPDADRIGLAVKREEGDYQVLSGNQTGALLLDYLLKKKQEMNTVPSNGVVIKTIVTSELGRAIADSYNLKTLDVLTGFKFIGEKIRQFEHSDKATFLFGYEESFGYLIEPFARDKDAIQPGLLAAEMCAYYKKQNMTLYDGLVNIFEKYGYYVEDLASFVFKGKEGAEKIDRIMTTFRSDISDGNVSDEVVSIEDYKTGIKHLIASKQKEEIDLPTSNVLKVSLKDGSWYCLRPSGTEPKIKCYFGVKERSFERAVERLEAIKSDVLQKVQSL
ncbi:phospho-sugar mutase [Salipaludibacillus sp. LMS25]|jgi:phosphoglucomutase|uniref:phospho-sugar mutase n=1 Tax=Salipaludibacillus sp. LMS25 TaxID=2924031 RepID=UPI0020D1A3EA|nr:phospho-sugar mutase [Salipaludibacillus sp. LMS25]UTR14151.1 phospho-sugar mutase [Salipaludibacillus sp. LMS25]